MPDTQHNPMTKRRTSKTKGQKLSTPKLRQVILAHLQRSNSKPVSARQLLKKLKIANNKNDVEKVLGALMKEGKILHDSRDGYFVKGKGRSKSKSAQLEGIVDMTRSGSAFILVDGRDEDVFVPARALESAIDGDRVLVEIEKKTDRRPQGRVLKVIRRAREQFIGIYQELKKHGIVSPDNDKVPFEFFIHPDKTMGAKDGEKVIVKVTDWITGQNKSPLAEVVAVLGAAGSHDIEMQAILLEEGFNLIFPEEVIRESESLPAEIPAEEIERRRDFRKTTTFTIDPVDAKDFDDALSYHRLDNGDVQVGIHIADVTHYVREGTELDKEAYDRSTSVYLVDRVLPMLPERLSNELCSLRPHEDSLCFSAVFTFDKDYKVIERWFGKTVIHSQHRFSYEEAQEVIDSGEGSYVGVLRELDKIAGILRTRRLKEGGLVFETDEVRFMLDENGVPIEILVKERKDTHLLIEDFMLLANKEVAKYIHNKAKGVEIPFVYRVHDQPDQQKLAELSIFAKELGFTMLVDTPAQVAKSFNDLAKAAQTNEALKILEPIAIRTMAKAEYSTDNIGHYGLAFTHYAHFTSPIRRYADVLVHRVLEANLGSTERVNKEALEQKSKHISAQERKAQKAERNSIKYKQAEYLSKHIGETFNGFVTGMIDRGIFVQLADIMAEGLVGFDSFKEPFLLDEGRLKAQGKKSGRTIKMGDRLQVRVTDADPAKRQISLEIVEE